MWPPRPPALCRRALAPASAPSPPRLSAPRRQRPRGASAATGAGASSGAADAGAGSSGASADGAPPRTLYDVLELQPGAHRADVRRAYRRLAAMHHPDASGAVNAAAAFQARGAARLST